MNILYFTEVFVYSEVQKRKKKAGKEKGEMERRKDEGPFYFYRSHYNF